MPPAVPSVGGGVWGPVGRRASRAARGYGNPVVGQGT